MTRGAKAARRNAPDDRSPRSPGPSPPAYSRTLSPSGHEMPRALPGYKNYPLYATNDADLGYRISVSVWVAGRPWEFPHWIRNMPDVVGNPDAIPDWRVAQLQENDGELPWNPDEMRYLRNTAVIKQVASEMARDTDAARKAGVPAPGDHPQRQPIQRAAGENFTPQSEQLNGQMAASANNERRRISATVPDKEQANKLQSTVPVALDPRMEVAGAALGRLHQKKANLTVEVERYEGQISQLQQSMQQPTHTTGKASQSGLESIRVKRKAVQERPSAMKIGERSGSNTSDSTEVNLVDETTKEDHLLHLADKICRDLAKMTANETIQLCGLAPLKLMERDPDAVLEQAHQKLHTFPFHSVPKHWRRLHEDATLSKAVLILRQQAQVEATRKGEPKRRRVQALSFHPPSQERVGPMDWLDELIRVLDNGMVLSGAPARRATFYNLFEQLQKFVGVDLTEDIPTRFNATRPPPLTSDFLIDRSEKELNFEEFQAHLAASTTPLIIPRALNGWPAVKKWQDPNYFFRHTLDGRRMVPVEIGKSYTEDGWSQTIISFRKFMTTYVLAKNPPDTAYLAQHDLFVQIPALRDDIMIPDYCHTAPPAPDAFASKTAGLEITAQADEPFLNAWLGPKGTKTPLHTDPYHNILCQVVGYKYVRLYPPDEREKLYPHGKNENGVGLENTSKVDVYHARQVSLGGSMDLDAIRKLQREFPKFKDAVYEEAILQPGECLYIPLGWWHYVESLSASVSVSFWWN